MPKPRPKPQARGLAAGLRALRKEAKLPMQWVADQLSWSQPTISRIEAGKRIVTPEEVSALLAIYRVTGEDRDRLIDMARGTDRNGWLETGAAGIPTQTTMLAQYETEAIRLISVDLMLVPGLLQTRAYTSAVMRAVGMAPTGIEPRVNLRQRRQRILDAAAPPHLTAILDEAALRRPQGGPRVMAEQLEHLLAMAQRPHIELRVIPFDHGGHAAVGGAYMLLEFATATPVVHVESSGVGIFLDEPEDVAIYLDITASLRSVALEHEPSVRFITAVAAEYQRE
ncbi:MAG: helix-turn-helix domain-containing protein [Pseudonocardiales bacterium]